MKPLQTLKLALQIIELTRPDEWRRHAQWCLWCILLAAAINAPFAVTRLVHERRPAMSPGSMRTADDVPKHWPTSTPHKEPWPAPDSWTEWRSFGKRHVRARRANPVEGKNGFSMEAYIYGWPLPVLEHKRLWWDWDDPALNGPKHQKPTHLRYLGLILNPIIIGGGSYLLILSPFVAFVIGRRFERLRLDPPKQDGQASTN